MHMEEEPTEGFKKMNWLVGQPPFPPETFGNLLLLYCKYAYYTPLCRERERVGIPAVQAQEVE
jgi:hypothetical protein